MAHTSSAPERRTRRFAGRGLSVLALLVLALLPLQGSIQSAVSAPAATTTRADSTSAAGRAAKTPKVFLALKKKRVTTKQHARVKVVVAPQAGAARASQRKLFGRVKVVVKGGGTKRPVLAAMADHRTVVTLPKLARGVYHVHAKFLGNAALKKSKSGTKKLMVVAPGGGGGGGPAGFPNESNTGVPAGTNLTPYNGPSTISKANTVIEGKSMGCIRVTAPGVVIRKSKISCSGSAVDNFDGDYKGTPLLLEDVEIDCKNVGGSSAVGDALFTIRRADIHSCENGLDVNQSVTVQDSYIHNMYNSAASHTDGIQLASRVVNGSVVQGAMNVQILHNTIYGVGADGSLGTSAIISNRSGDRTILIQDNLLAGGAYTLYCDGDNSEVDFRVIDNHFSRKFSQKVGAFGPSDGCRNVTKSGNVYDETGAPVSLG